MKKISKKLFNFFLAGLVLVLPIFATFYIVIKIIFWADDSLGAVFKSIFGFVFPGFGLLATLILLTMTGFLVNTFLGKPFFGIIDKMFSRMPYVKILYSSIKDFSQAFLGEKKKFNEPVLVKMNDSGIMRPGFITQHDLSHIKIYDKVAVYFPDSYNFAGNLFLVPKENIVPLEANPTEIMKFIVTAGVSSLEDQV